MDMKDKFYTYEDMKKMFAFGKQHGLAVAGLIRNTGENTLNQEDIFTDAIESIAAQCNINSDTSKLKHECNYILTADHGNRVLKCLKCGNVNPI
jgi:hypothetical protein